MTTQSFPIAPDLDQLNRALAELAAKRQYCWQWLLRFAGASIKGKIIAESELPNGHYVVALEWPTRFAYLEFEAQRLTMEATLQTASTPTRS